MIDDHPKCKGKMRIQHEARLIARGQAWAGAARCPQA
jgi:hypothetical protein